MTFNEAINDPNELSRWPGETQVFSENNCFLCGVGLDATNRTDEHVFPKWILNEFRLWDQKLVLLNGTGIAYGQLRIPCCSPCNGIYLSEIENKVATAYRTGFESFSELDSNVLFLWLAKICYGLLVREQHLAIDRADPSAGPIVSSGFLEKFRMHHYLLQRVLGTVTWDENPASIVLFRTKVSEAPEENFDFCDGPFGPFIALRLGPVGVIAVLQDWGAHTECGWPPFGLESAMKIELAPLQFRELMAKGRDCGVRFNRTLTYLVGQYEGVAKVMCLPLGGCRGGQCGIRSTSMFTRRCSQRHLMFRSTVF